MLSNNCSNSGYVKHHEREPSLVLRNSCRRFSFFSRGEAQRKIILFDKEHLLNKHNNLFNQSLIDQSILFIISSFLSNKDIAKAEGINKNFRKDLIKYWEQIHPKIPSMLPWEKPRYAKSNIKWNIILTEIFEQIFFANQLPSTDLKERIVIRIWKKNFSIFNLFPVLKCYAWISFVRYLQNSHHPSLIKISDKDFKKLKNKVFKITRNTKLSDQFLIVLLQTRFTMIAIRSEERDRMVNELSRNIDQLIQLWHPAVSYYVIKTYPGLFSTNEFEKKAIAAAYLKFPKTLKLHIRNYTLDELQVIYEKHPKFSEIIADQIIYVYEKEREFKALQPH